MDTQPINPATRILELSAQYDSLKADRNAAWWTRFNALNINDVDTAARADDTMARLDKKIDAARREMRALIALGGVS